MFNWHKKMVTYWENKLGISTYGMLWIAFFKGIVIGLLMYHIFIK